VGLVSFDYSGSGLIQLILLPLNLFLIFWNCESRPRDSDIGFSVRLRLGCRVGSVSLS
jgi:hypothetical protein